jgi:hypothetical protein
MSNEFENNIAPPNYSELSEVIQQNSAIQSKFQETGMILPPTSAFQNKKPGFMSDYDFFAELSSIFNLIFQLDKDTILSILNDGNKIITIGFVILLIYTIYSISQRIN